MQLIQTNDQANRQSFRDALQHKVEAALNAPPPKAPIVADQLLLLPPDFAELSATDLHFSLMHNRELKHSRQSANLAVEILTGKAIQPENVEFQVVQLEKPVVIPQFAEKQVKRSPAKQLTPPDASQQLAREDEEKRVGFKNYLAQLAARVPEVPGEIPVTTMLIPHDYNELNATELHFALCRNPELKHSAESADFVVDILTGVQERPEFVEFESVVLDNPVALPAPTAPKHVRGTAKPTLAADTSQERLDVEAIKRVQYKQSLADKTNAPKPAAPRITQQVVRLIPEGYEAMNQGELHYALVRNPEFQHTNEQAIVTVDMLSGKIGTPDNVVFRTIGVENLNLAPTVVPVEKPQPKRSPAKQVALTPRAQIPVGSAEEGQRAILIPHNYDELSEVQLHFALSHNQEFGHSYDSVYEALDIMFGRKPVPNGVVFTPIEVENPIERAY